MCKNSLLILNFLYIYFFFIDAGNAVSAKITTAGIGIVKNNDRKTLRNRK